MASRWKTLIGLGILSMGSVVHAVKAFPVGWNDLTEYVAAHSQYLTPWGVNDALSTVNYQEKFSLQGRRAIIERKGGAALEVDTTKNGAIAQVVNNNVRGDPVTIYANQLSKKDKKIISNDYLKGIQTQMNMVSSLINNGAEVDYFRPFNGKGNFYIASDGKVVMFSQKNGADHVVIQNFYENGIPNVTYFNGVFTKNSAGFGAVNNVINKVSKLEYSLDLSSIE